MNSENIKTFSAKDLCSRSCMQIKMFTEHPELRPKPNINVNEGVSFQHQIALNTENVIGEEMRGTYNEDNIWINFSNDIVCENQIIEVKSIRETPEQWYFEACVLQCAMYKALLEKSNKKLVTATFYAEMGNPVVETSVSKNVDYYLQFGNDRYLINVKNPDKIVDFYVKKAKASMDWATAKEFDNQYKHKEYIELSNFFNFVKI